MDIQHFSSLALVSLASLLAAISPGPDFFIVVRNSLAYSRKIGILTSLGVSLALVIHLTYTLVGIGVILAESSLIYNILKYVGAVYLLYLGFSGIAASFKRKKDALNIDVNTNSNDISSWIALRQGFLTNLLNPKAALFFVSLFSQFIGPETSGILKVEYAMVNWSITLAWFLFLSCLITSQVFRSKINRFRIYIDRVMGSCLMLIGLKMLLI